MPPMAKYGIVTLVPLICLMAAATVWGGFAWAALIWLTLIAALLDHMLDPPSPAAGNASGTYTLPILLALGHAAVVPLALIALAQGNLTTAQSIALFLATASFIGQVSHPNAHELIHRKSRTSQALGALVYVSMGFGHHVSAHRLVHHRYVATPQDPNTPHMGESFWHYLPRAWVGSFRAGLRAEVDRLARRGEGPWSLRNPYWLWIGGAAFSAFTALLIAGPIGLLALLGLWLLTGTQILLSDYIQHYGLRRLTLPTGRIEPVGPHHSWNAPRGFSSYLMMNAPSHSEHHLHPDRSYAEIGADTAAPNLPYALPIMAMVATLPPVWHRIMDRRAAKVMAAAEERLTLTSRAA